MTKRAELPDGTILEFPDETPDAVMDRVVKAQLFNQSAGRAPAAAPATLQQRASAQKPKFETGSGFGARVMHNLGAAVGLGDEFEQFGLGIGRNIDRAYRGLKQLGAESLASQSGLLATGLERAGLQTPARAIGRNITAPLARVSERERIAEQQARQVPTAGPAMTAGDITATVGSLLGPGALLRGTSAAPVFLPRTIAGNALQGGVIGGIQPIAEESERGQNVGAGVLFGGGGALIPRAVGTAYRATSSLLEPFTQAGQERIAARLLRRSAIDPTRLTAGAPSAIPGVQRTLAEEALDPGIAQLQRQFPVQLADQAAANQAARVQAIRQTFGDEAAIPALESQMAGIAQRTRSGLAGVVNPPPPPPVPPEIARLREAFGAPVETIAQSPLRVDLGPVRETLGRMVDKFRGRPTVQASLRYVQDLMQTPPRNAAEAWNIRQTIDDLMRGKLGKDAPDASAARSQLMTAKGILDRQMRQAFPEWREFLSQYRGLATQADQARVGAELLRRGVPLPGGDIAISPAQLSRATRDPNALVRAATGFPRAQAATTLTAPQQGLLSDLLEDAARVQASQNLGRMVGSNTAQNLATQNVLRSIAGENRIASGLLASQPAQRIAGVVERTYGVFGVPDRLQQVVADALSEPAMARKIIARLPASDRRIVTNALARIGGTGGALSPALTE